MGLCERKSVERRFRGYVEGLVKVIGHADRAGPVARLLHWTGADEWAQECGADGGGLTAPRRAPAQHQSLLHFVGQGALVGRGAVGQSAGDGAASD